VSRPGRALRQAMRDSASADSPERVRERVAMRKAGELAVNAREQRYPELTPENASEAMAYQEAAQKTEYARLMEVV
jgi:hypothetical protein